MIYNFNNKFYKYKYMNKIIIISVLVYGYFFFKLGNTVYRTNSLGDKSLNLMSLLEGFVGPIRSLFLLIRYSGIIPALTFLKFEFFRLSNPYSAFFFVYYINKLIEINFKK